MYCVEDPRESEKKLLISAAATVGRHMSHQVKPQATAVLHLDRVDSSGASATPIQEFPARLMALSLHQKPLWFGFVIAESSPIVPGALIRVPIAFLDEKGAHQAFRAGSSILFGDGVRSRGVLVIDEYLSQ